MSTITIPKETKKNAHHGVRRNLRAWRAVAGIWRTKKIEDPLKWQRLVRKEWGRVLP